MFILELMQDELILHLKGKGIATGCHYTPLTRQPLFKEFASECNYIETEADRMITLPLHAELTKEEVSYVIKSIEEFLIKMENFAYIQY